MLPPTAANAAYQQSGFSRKGQPTGPPGVANGQPPPGFGMLDAYRQAAQQRLGQQGQYPNQPYQVGLQPYQGALATQRGQLATSMGQGFRYDPNETDPRRTEGYWMNRGRTGGAMPPPQTPPGMWGGMRAGMANPRAGVRAGMANPLANALQQRQQQFRQRQYTPPSPGVAGGATPPGLQLGMQDAHRQAAQQRAAMQGQQGGQLPLGLQNHPGYQQAQQRLGQRGQPATPMRQQMMVHALRNLR
jgi:hypothetical protein